MTREFAGELLKRLREREETLKESLVSATSGVDFIRGQVMGIRAASTEVQDLLKTWGDDE